MVQLIGAGFLGVFSIPLVVIDIQQRRLPNKITLPAIAISLLGILAACDWGKTLWAVGCAVAVFTLAVLISLKGWFGMGDAKLLASMTLILAWYGYQLVLLALLVTFLSAGLVVGLRLALNKIDRHSTIALGPYLLLGFWLVLLAGLFGWLGH